MGKESRNDCDAAAAEFWAEREDREGCNGIHQQQVTKAPGSSRNSDPCPAERGAKRSVDLIHRSFGFSHLLQAQQRKRQPGHGSCWEHRHAVGREEESCDGFYGKGS